MKSLRYIFQDWTDVASQSAALIKLFLSLAVSNKDIRWGFFPFNPHKFVQTEVISLLSCFVDIFVISIKINH